ncbi:unnamed protein product [Phytomonas sp. EM1]|nr:unnamed protein product [Phytomonas sp. EM1]|eukprot:CCW65790.1 unnamed protein product [Phytomonas sp. isolate EM1]
MDPHVEAAPTYRTLALGSLSSTIPEKGISRSAMEDKYFKRMQRGKAAVTESSSHGLSDSRDTVSMDSIDATVSVQNSFPSRDACAGEIGAKPDGGYPPSREEKSSLTTRIADQVGDRPASRQNSGFTVHDTRLPSIRNDILGDSAREYHHGSGSIGSFQTLTAGGERSAQSTPNRFQRHLSLREETRRKQIQLASKRAREAKAALYDLWLREGKKSTEKQPVHLRTGCGSTPSIVSIPQSFSQSSTSLPQDSFKPGVSTCTSPLGDSLADSTRTAVAENESTNSSFFVDDESLDIQADIGTIYSQLRLYRTDNSVSSGDRASNLREGHTNDDGTVKSTEGPTVGRPVYRTSSLFPLQSSAYAESVVLTQRSQQVFVLMSLLCEAHRHSWKLHLELLQLYHYYILPILGSSRSAAERTVLEKALRNSGSRALGYYHTALASFAGMDFQLFRYQHDRIWRKLFADVRQYLGMDSTAAEGGCDGSEGVRSTGGGDGTLRFAATLLHSLDLFERQHGMQMALRDATRWITWYYYCYLPSTQVGGGGAAGHTADGARELDAAAVTPEDCSAARSTSGSRDNVSKNSSDLFSSRGVSESIAGANGNSGCTSHSHAEGETLLLSTNAEKSTGESVTREEDVIEPPEFNRGYVSLDWQAAQDEQVRNMVYNIRLYRKLARMDRAVLTSRVPIPPTSTNIETKSEREGGNPTNCVTPNKIDELPEEIADVHPRSPEDRTRISSAPFPNAKVSSPNTVSAPQSGPTPRPAGVPTARPETVATSPVCHASQKSMTSRKRFKTFRVRANFHDSLNVGCFGLSFFTLHSQRSKPHS